MTGTPSKFENASLSEAQFTDVSLRAARFADVDLAGASFSNVSLAGAKFDDVNFSNVAITDANIEGMTVNGVRLSAGKTAAVVDLRAFVPARDHALATQFYLDLGFRLNWSNEQVAELEIGGFRFLLQNFHAPEHTANFMMHLQVENADDWWRRIGEAGLQAKYPDIIVKPPALQPWGLRVLYLTDPSGVLWHIADRRGA